MPLYAHVKTYVRWHLLTRRDRFPLAITQGYAPFKSAFGAEGVEVLQDRMQNDVFSDPLGPLTKDKYGCINFISSHMGGQGVTRH
jgi:hypothetical protein